MLGIFFFRRYQEKTKSRYEVTDSKALLSAILAFVLAVLLFVRGGLGLAISFVFPFLRGYDRAVVLVTFSALLVLGLIASGKLTRKNSYRVGATAVLILMIFENASGVAPRVQNLANQDNGYFYAAGVSTIDDLVKSAGNNLGDKCSVLTLPVNTYPVDFPAGIVSWLTYESLKPGLIESKIKWTAGAIPGTPGSDVNSRFRELYVAKDYAQLLIESKSAGACGVVVFGGLQNAMNLATVGTFDRSEIIEGEVMKQFGKICFSDDQTGIKLFCPSKPKT
jgi:hypothetical protein